MRRALGTIVALLLAVTLSGCGPDFMDLPLPGKGVSGDTMKVTAEFEEALNLATGATVKVNGTSVGKVQEVRAADFKAEVDLLVRADAQIRRGATARLRYTTPLGELFVDVTNPESGAVLADGARMTPKVTDTAPTVEDALASASLLVNGGGLAQLGIVTDELNTILGGREQTLKRAFRQINLFLSEANASTAQIERTLRALADVSHVLAAREQTINRAVRELRPAAAVLRENTDDFSTLLQAVVKLSTTANGVANKTKDQLIALIRQIEPILAELAALKGDFGPGLADLVAIGKGLDQVVPGDYLNLAGVLMLTEVGGVGPVPEVPVPDLPLPELPLPEVPEIPGVPLPDLPGAPESPGLPLPDLPLGLRASHVPQSSDQHSEVGLTTLVRGAK